MKRRMVTLVFFIVVCFGCSSDNMEILAEKHSGTVIGFDGCSGKNGLYYKIKLDDENELGFIRTNTLPDSLSEKGTQILFAIRETEDYDQVCQQHIAPPYHFYEIFDVARKE